MQNMYNQDSIGGNSFATANYTLPGIMQYLQSQFTQVERNRLQGELERSSLKLKIIELENDRNALLRKNKQLEVTIEELKAEIATFKAGNTPRDGSSKFNGEIPKDDVIECMHSTDVSKIIEARKFLKSATNEILYLLKTPTIEFEAAPTVGGITGIAALSGNDNESDMFYNHPLLTTETLSSNKEIENRRHEFQENVEKHLNDIIIGNENLRGVDSDSETIVDKGVKSDSDSSLAGGINNISNDSIEEEDDDDDEEDEEDYDDDDFDDEDADDIEYLKHPKDEKRTKSLMHKAIQKEKLLHLLKKSPKKQHRSSQNFKKLTLLVKQEQDPDDIHLVGDQIVVQYDKTVAIYGDIFDNVKLVKAISKPDQTIDVKVSDKYITFAATDSVTVSVLTGEDIKLIKDIQGIQGIDIEDDKLLIVTDSTIDIFEIGVDLKQVSEIGHNIEGDFVSTHFVKGISSFDVAVLTSTILYLYDSKSLNLAKTIPLSHFDEFLLTSKFLVLKFVHGYFVLNFDNCTEFKAVIIPEEEKKTKDHMYKFSGSESIFAIKKAEESTENIQIKIFKVTTSGTVNSLTDVTLTEKIKHISFGKTLHGPVVCLSVDGTIQLQHIAM